MHASVFLQYGYVRPTLASAAPGKGASLISKAEAAVSRKNEGASTPGGVDEGDESEVAGGEGRNQTALSCTVGVVSNGLGTLCIRFCGCCRFVEISERFVTGWGGGGGSKTGSALIVWGECGTALARCIFLGLAQGPVSNTLARCAAFRVFSFEYLVVAVDVANIPLPVLLPFYCFFFVVYLGEVLRFTPPPLSTYTVLRGGCMLQPTDLRADRPTYRLVSYYLRSAFVYIVPLRITHQPCSPLTASPLLLLVLTSTPQATPPRRTVGEENIASPVKLTPRPNKIMASIAAVARPVPVQKRN